MIGTLHSDDFYPDDVILQKIAQEFQEIYESQGKKQSPKRSSWFAGVKKFVDGLRA